MDIGIGLPNTVPGTEGRSLIDWARNAEAAGFSTLGTIGRIVYPNYEELISLAAAAASPADGWCPASASAARRRLHRQQPADRGQRTAAGCAADRDEADLGRGSRGFAGGTGPEPVRPGGPELILGGSAGASFRRVALLGGGWIMGGGTPDVFSQGAAKVAAAWQEAGRPGWPRKLTLAYFALGAGARAQADNYLLNYYGWLGDVAQQIAGSAAISAEMVKAYAAAFEANGCDEIIFVPSTSCPDQIDLLAEAVL